MFSLMRVSRSLANVAAFRTSTCADAASTALWTRCRSIHNTPNILKKGSPNKTVESSQQRNEVVTRRKNDIKIRHIFKAPGEWKTRESPAEDSMLAKETRIPLTRAKQRKRLVGSLTSDDLIDTTPSAELLWLSNANKSNRPTDARAREIRIKRSKVKSFVAVRREPVKSLPTVVELTCLSDDTTLGDVLLSIHEALVAGKLRVGEARIADAQMHKPSATQSSWSAIVDFSHPSGAERIDTLSQAGRFTVRGVVPQTLLRRRAGARKFPTPGGTETSTPLGGFAAMDAADKKRYLNRLKVNVNLVRKTHLNYNRDPSSAVEDEEQLNLNTDFKSIFANAPQDSVGNVKDA